MTKYHEIKIQPTWAASVLSGQKRFEIRKNDRDYQVGDIVTFAMQNIDGEWVLDPRKEYVITYILHGPMYGLKKGYCVFSFERLKVDND